MNDKAPSFAERRAEIEKIARDAAALAGSLVGYADLFDGHARFLEGEAEAMKRAEERFKARAHTNKAARKSRPSTST